MEEEHQDGIEENEAMKMEEVIFDEKILEEVSRDFEQEKEKELENENKKLHQELELLKEKNETLKKKVQELSDINKKFEKKIVKVEGEMKAISLDLIDLAKLTEEFEEEYGRKTMRLLMEVEKKSNALGEVKEAFKKKEEALCWNLGLQIAHRKVLNFF
ncbi:hypothetical protein Dsin_028830 [Dipteronia sinensis]|uniref:Uncharacterized protein n=1 Tax=Dipteronia sinensis TaxID=43782 RepID=A0AAD9ZRW3_9ROSI|nr:hypothetical protein Dsin_028830 [Dipteronia sinensis]